MKAVALGGAGDMGRTAVRVVAGFGLLEELLVADLDEAGADAVARQVRDAGAPTPVRASSSFILMGRAPSAASALPASAATGRGHPALRGCRRTGIET